MKFSKCTSFKSAILLLFPFLASIPSARAEWEWARTCLNPGGNSSAYSVTTDAAGDVIVAGVFDHTFVVGTDTLTNTSGYGGLFIIKYNAAGDVIWAKAAHGGVGDIVPPVVKTDANRNIIISGNFWGELSFDSATVVHGIHDHDFFVAKFDPSGSPIWARAQGGNRNDFASAVSTDKAGNVLVTGYYNSTSISFGSDTLLNVNDDSAIAYLDKTDIFLAKYDASGNFLWARSIGEKGDEKAKSVITDTSGNVYIAGRFVEDDSSFTVGDTLITRLMYSTINTYAILYKYDASGNRIWAKFTYLGEATHLAIGKTGDVYMAGTFGIGFMSFNGYGDFDPDNISLENEAHKRYFQCSGGFCNPVDVFVARYSSDGKALWARNHGGVNGDFLTAMALDPADNVYIAGSAVDDSIYFGESLVTQQDPMGDKFWARYDANGDLRGASLGMNPKNINSMAVAQSGAIYFAGDFYYTMRLGSIELYCSYGTTNMFVAKCDERTLGVYKDPVLVANDIRVYPNPNNGQMKVSLGAGGYSSMQVTDCLGRMIYSAALSGAETSVDLQLPALAPGIYVLNVTGTEQRAQVLFDMKL